MATEATKGESGETFSEAILGKDFFQHPLIKRIAALPASWLAAGGAALLGALLYLPYVGAVGLWDPWETHYGEVGRMMIQRHDYVHPYWENAWFFSKPPLTMWMDVLGMQLVGTNRTAGALALYTEWGMRLPFVLLSIGALALMALAVFRVAGARVALAATFVLATMPMYWLLTRQAVTDTPFVCTQISAMACAMIGELDESTRHRSGWWYAFYVFCALSMLAKGLLGFGVPGVVLLLYAGLCRMDWDAASLTAHLRWLWERKFRDEVRRGVRPMPFLWNQLYRMKFLTGVGIFLLICGPWFATLFAFKGVDDEGRRFWERFLIYDHLSRITSGVHTTTPGGTFIYFIEQGAYAMFPWVALLPGALALAARARLRGGDRKDQLTVLALLWASLTFSLVAFSATKFHHYVFPVLPGVALLIALFIDRLWEEGIERHAVALLFGLILFALVGKDLAEHPKNFTDLFVYNYDRPYPLIEVAERPLTFFGRRTLWIGDLLAGLLLTIGGFQIWDTFRLKEGSVGARARALGLGLAGAALLALLSARSSVSSWIFIAFAPALVSLYLGYQATRATREKRAGLWATAVAAAVLAVALFVLGAASLSGRDDLLAALTQPVSPMSGMGVAFAIAGVLCVIAALQRARVLLFGSFWALAFCFALWFNWSHWVNLSHHWTQRDQFWRYYRLRRADEPIAAFLMNWRGETFYSRNTVKQIKDNAVFGRYAALPGRKWSLVEHYRLPILKAAAGPGKTVTPVDSLLNNKFVLVSIE